MAYSFLLYGIGTVPSIVTLNYFFFNRILKKFLSAWVFTYLMEHAGGNNGVFIPRQFVGTIFCTSP